MFEENYVKDFIVQFHLADADWHFHAGEITRNLTDGAGTPILAVHCWRDDKTGEAVAILTPDWKIKSFFIRT